MAPGVRRCPTSHRQELAVLAPRGAETVRDLPDGRVGAYRLDQGRHQVLVSPGALPDPTERGFPGGGIPFRADASQALHLAPFAIRVDPLERWRPVTLVAEAIHPDHDLA